MGFHSYRNIGFSFTDAETTCRKWREKFIGFDGKENSKYISVEEDEDVIAVSYLGSRYRLCKKDGILEKQTEHGWSDKLQMNEALAVYHYIGDKKNPVHASGEWVPEHTLDPVRIRTSDRIDPLFVSFAREYTGRVDQFAKRCELAGGRFEASSGDTAWVFYPFPEIPVKLVFWDADEDFPSQIKAYVKKSATDLVHYEAVSFMIADIFLKIDETDL